MNEAASRRSRRLPFPLLLAPPQNNKDLPFQGQIAQLILHFQRLTISDKPVDRKTANAASFKPFRLLDLPVELRKLIYDYVIDHRGVFYNGTCAISRSHVKKCAFKERYAPERRAQILSQLLVAQRPCIVASERFQAWPSLKEEITYLSSLDSTTRKLKYGLVLTSKQLSDEFTEHVYETVTFNFIMGHCTVISFVQWQILSCLSATTLCNLRRCKFWFIEESLYASYLNPRYISQRQRSMSIHVPAIVQQLPSLRTLSAGSLCPIFYKPPGLHHFRNSLGASGYLVTDYKIDKSVYKRGPGSAWAEGLFEIPFRAPDIKDLVFFPFDVVY
ncbi:MAG: hypothetical protein M1831_005952 [Alyxoria varia]|nr:MAG: hypothetical protein M1831_005952 [Alyxoria varia]